MDGERMWSRRPHKRDDAPTAAAGTPTMAGAARHGLLAYPQPGGSGGRQGGGLAGIINFSPKRT